jgi:hypothetical protein
MTNNNIFASVVISIATTGLLLALMFMGYQAVSSDTDAVHYVGFFLLAASAIAYVIDVVFDSLLADILRFGHIVKVAEIADPTIHMMYRVLLGGISTVGEALAITLIVGMPVIKIMIRQALGNTSAIAQPTKTTSYAGTSRQYQEMTDLQRRVYDSTPTPPLSGRT